MSELSAQVTLLWHYLSCQPLSQRLPQEADVALVFGSYAVDVVDEAVYLYQQGLVRYILVSGDKGRGTEDWMVSEAQLMAQRAYQAGVPKAAVLLEEGATNSGANVRLSRQLCASMDFRRGVVIGKASSLRRAWATVLQYWPELDWQVFSRTPTAQSQFDRYPQQDVIGEWVGEISRMLAYPKRGWQQWMPIPDEVETAFCDLCAAGFDQQCVKL